MSASGGDWLSVYRAVFDHPKAKRLGKRLGLEVPAAVGYLICLWTWCMTIAPDGDLSRFDPEDIEAAAGWGGEVGLFVLAATECRWLDDTGSGVVIHDWADWAGTWVARRANERQRSADRRSAAGRPPVDRRLTAGTDLTDLTDLKEPLPNSDESGVSDFTAFWSNYPRKVGMTAAKKRWKNLGVADRRAATLAAQHFADYVRASATELRFVPHPSTFIGPKRVWEDWAAGRPPGYEGGNGDGPAGTAVVKRPVCPECEVDLTVDEDGEHCPMCPWRSSPQTATRS